MLLIPYTFPRLACSSTVLAMSCSSSPDFASAAGASAAARQISSDRLICAGRVLPTAARGAETAIGAGERAA